MLSFFSSFFNTLYKKVPSQTKLVMWVVVFPLLLAGIGVWEYASYAPQPVAPLGASELAEIQHIEGMLERLKGDSFVTVQINGSLYGNPLASQLLRKAIEDIRNPPEQRASGAIAWIVRPAAVISVLAGVLAALVGALGLWRVHTDGQRAMRSREELMTLFASWRERLPAYLSSLLGTQMLAIAGLLVVRCAVAYQVLVLGNPTRGEMKWQLALVTVAGMLLWGGVLTLRHLMRALKELDKAPLEVMGHAVSKQQALGLWQYVGEMARRTGAAEPVNVVVGIADSFYVTAHDVLLQPGGEQLTGETMYLPLTYLSLLRRSEIDAVVAHELGHFVGDDTAYSVRFSPIYHRLVQSLHSLDDIRSQDRSTDGLSTPVITFIVYLLTRFDLAVKHWSRQREFAADQVSARVAGHDATARALIRMTAVNTTVRAVIDAVARRPDEAGNDLIAMLTQAVNDKGMAIPDFAQEVATTHPSDTHPPTLERLQAVGLPLGKTLAESALTPPDPLALQWVRSLFADSQSLQTQLLEDFKGQSRQRNEAVREQLSSMASKVQGSVDIYEGAFNAFLFWGIGLLILLIPIFVLLGGGNGSRQAMMVALGAAACGLLMLAVGVMFWKRSKLVVMQLRPNGIKLPLQEQEISWQDLEGYSANVVNSRTLVMNFTLAPKATAIALKSRNFGRVRYKKAARRLLINVTKVKGMKVRALHDLVNDYRRAFYARDRLQGM